MVKKTIELNIEEVKEYLASSSILKVNYTIDRVIEGALIMFLLFTIGALISNNTALQGIMYFIISLIVVLNIGILTFLKRRIKRELIKQSLTENDKE